MKKNRLLIAPNPSQLDRLHGAALAILERTGLQIENEEARALLERGGAHVDGVRVRFPPKLVEWAISVTPASFTMYRRDGSKAYTIGGDEIVFNAGSGCTSVLDWQTGEVRPYLKADAVEAAKLTDGLPQCCDVTVTGMITDVPPSIAERLAFVIKYEHSLKPMSLMGRTPGLFEGAMAVIQRDVGGLDQVQRYPFVHAGVNTHSPLVLPPEVCDRLMAAARLNIPTGASAWPQIGATAPITVAGTVALAHAEHLAALVLVQLTREGSRFHYGGSAPVFDMRDVVCSTGAPERALGTLVLMQLGRHLGLPVRSNAIATDAKGINVQAGAERMLQCLACCLGGATMIGGLGWLDNVNVMSHEMLILDAEMVEALQRFLPGLSVEDDDLALDTIDAVGPFGHFLGEEHTFARYRTGLWYTSVWLRTPALPKPEDEETLRRRVREKLTATLAAHRPPSLSPAVRQALDDFLAAPVAE